MQQKKLWTDITEKELLESLQSNSDEPSIEVKDITDKTDVVDFMSYFNVRSGDKEVRIRVLYYAYKDWSPNPIKYTQFCTQIAKYLMRTKDKVFINEDVLSISKKAMDYIKTQVKKKKYVVLKHKKVHKFLVDKKIESGENMVDYLILYRLYENWSYENKEHPVGFRAFAEGMQCYLKKTHNFYYLVNLNKLREATTNEEYQKAQEWTQKVRKKGKVQK